MSIELDTPDTWTTEIRDYPPAGLTQDEVDQLVDTLEAPYGNRIQRVIRAAMRSSEDPRQAAVAVAQAVEEQGLEPAPPVEPLPVIVMDDIHLVCWQAIVPAGIADE